MKKKKMEKFCKRTGIVNLDHEEENFFVVYAYFFDLPKSRKEELGEAISKGKTSEEALKKGIVNLTNKIINMQRSIDRMEENIRKINKNLPRENREIILGINNIDGDFDKKTGEWEYFESKEKSNADIGIDENGDPFAFIG